GMPPVVVHPALNKELKTQLRNLFLTMDQDPRGMVILDDLIIDRFVLANDADYDSIRKMVAAVRK
ncbi:MAG: PhnD/SsuA/transferrin family substrate-binding protein, partial [Chloroflexi bacterium]|nr:PhnD/SsuA/transferrin family substrate-binding protein [Chloroflexota bacterium]